MYKVLLVDDDKSTLCGLRQFEDWESCGFAIEDEAYDGVGALEKLSEKSFDVVITDIRMPGMNGLQFLSELKARKIDSCFMLLSTYNDFEYAQQGIRLGVFDYIIKPVEDDALCGALQRIKRHLDEKKFQQAKLMGENLRFYYPKNQERKLIQLLLAGDNEVIDEAANICIELFKLTNQDIRKTSLLLEQVIVRVTEELYNAFPWFRTLEVIGSDSTLPHVEGMDDIKVKFAASLRRMLEVIKKYELHCPDSVVGKTCLYVMEHIEGDIKLEEIAEKVQISRSYLGKLFKEKTGGHFTDYVTKLKMEHAKYLLGTGDYKNYEVSEKLGYSSPDYFCHLFKNYTGHTPMEFRKMGIRA